MHIHLIGSVTVVNTDVGYSTLEASEAWP